jgi:hypothetical protein
LLIAISLALALTTAVPAAAHNDATADLRLTIGEDTLNQLAQSAAANAVQLDLLPGNQVNVQADTTVSALGATVPVHLSGLFGVQITAQSSLEVRLIKANISGFNLPQETLAESFNSPLAAINQNLNEMVTNASTLLGVPLLLTGLGTTDTELWLEARTAP